MPGRGGLPEKAVKGPLEGELSRHSLAGELLEGGKKARLAMRR